MPEAFSPLAELLVNQYGPILRGPELRNALGFDSSQAFLRAKRLGQLQVNVFSLPGRRGYFALTTEVANWLNACGQQIANESTEAIK